MLENITINMLAGNFFKDILLIIIGLIIGAVVTFILTKKSYEKQLKENPPISEKQIRSMFKSMGVPASEKRIKKVLKDMGINNDGSPINGDSNK